VEEVGEAWTRRQRRSERRRSVVLTAVLGHDGEGRADGTVPGHFDVEEEQGAVMEEEWGAGVEVHTEEARGRARHGGGVGIGGCVAGKWKG
jgi:hypothetical protein